MKQKVVVIASGYTNRLGIIRALGKAGYYVIVVVQCHKDYAEGTPVKKPIDCYSKYVSEVYYCSSDKDKMIKCLLEHCTDPDQKVVLIPFSDFAAPNIGDNFEILSSYFLFPHISREGESISYWMDKFRQKETANKVGLNVAKSWTIDIINGGFSIPNDIIYPCFPKPVATIPGTKRFFGKCSNETELRRSIENFKNNAADLILVEEFKAIETECALLGLATKEEVIIPGVIEITELGQGRCCGVARKGKVKPVTIESEFIEKVKTFIKATGYIGIFDVDYYRANGLYYFSEMNLRPGGSGYSYTKSGVNLPAMYVEYMCTGEYNKDSNIKDECWFVNEKTCLSDFEDGFISIRQYFRLLRSQTIHFVKDEKDSMPYKIYKRQFCKPLIKHFIKSFVKSVNC